ncbi:MAG TPA: methyltransferase domain-containing protein [Candidatus Limnocylindrales bacterium]
MTDQEARYDTIAEGYAELWSPVHRPATLGLLGEVERDVAAGARTLIDVGCGTGALVAEAAGRWPGVAVDGVDVSAGMLAIAERTGRALPAAVQTRIRFSQAPADRLPYPDASFDVALTSFVLQLVPSRHRALREIRRVLRPAGRLALVTWLRGGEPLIADRAYDEALVAAGLEPRESGGGDDDLDSPAEAVAVLRRAGFAEVTARGETLVHAFTPESFLGFIARFDDADQFDALDEADRARLEADVLARLRALPSDGLRLVAPIVYATGRRT